MDKEYGQWSAAESHKDWMRSRIDPKDTELVIYEMLDRADNLNVQQVITNSQLEEIKQVLDKAILEALEMQNRMFKVGACYTAIICAFIVFMGVMAG